MVQRLSTPAVQQIEAAASLLQAQKIAQTHIDVLAEKRRKSWVTPGDGQAQEYVGTRAEAERYQSGDAEIDYPYLQAEVAALQSIGQTVDMGHVAADIRQLSATLDRASAVLKQHRRVGKMKIATAQSKEEVVTIFEEAAAAIRAVSA